MSLQGDSEFRAPICRSWRIPRGHCLQGLLEALRNYVGIRVSPTRDRPVEFAQFQFAPGRRLALAPILRNFLSIGKSELQQIVQMNEPSLWKYKATPWNPSSLQEILLC